MTDIEQNPNEGLSEEERIKKVEQEAKEAKEALEALQAKSKKETEAMIADLQAERDKRQAAEEVLKTKGEQDGTQKETDPKKALQELLEEKDKEEAEKNKVAALEEFRNSVKELSKENDQADIVYSEFENELKKFNLEGLKTKEEFQNRYKEVYDYMNRKQTNQQPNQNFYQGTPSGGGSDPKEGSNVNLSDAEKRLIKDMGWTEERYLERKSKRPGFVASLLKYRS